MFGNFRSNARETRLMSYTTPYSVYKETGIKTASKGKLIVMLYEGALRHATDALELFDETGKIPVDSIEKFHNHIVKTQEIITELMVSLDLKQGGDIAKNLMALYRFFNHELMSISISHERSKLEVIVQLLTELHSSWNIVVNTSAAHEPHVSINING